MTEDFLNLNDYDFTTPDRERFDRRGQRIFRHATLTGLIIHLIFLSFINRNGLLILMESLFILLYALLIIGFYRTKEARDWRIPAAAANMIPFLSLVLSHAVLKTHLPNQYYMDLGLSLIMIASTQFLSRKSLLKTVIYLALSGWFIISLIQGIMFVRLAEENQLAIIGMRQEFFYSYLFLTIMLSLSALLSILNYNFWEKFRHIEERKSTVQKLLTRESKSGLFITDSNFKYVLGNPSFYQILEREYSPESQILQDVMENVIYPLDFSPTLQAVNELRRENTDGLPFDLRVGTEESFKWIRVDGLFTSDEEKNPLFLGTLTDIDYLKRSEEKARSDSSSIKALLMVGQIYPWELDLSRDTFIPLASENKGESPFSDSTQLSFLKHIESVHMDFRPVVEQAFDSIRNGDDSVLDVDYLFNSEGTERYVWLKDVGFLSRRDKDGNPLTISGYTMDIDTDRRRTLRIDQAFRASGFIPWQWDRTKGFAELDEEYIDLLGVPLDKFPISRRDFFMRLIHSEDRSRVRDFFSHHVTDSRQSSRIGNPIQFRIQFKGMEESIWIEGRIVGVQYDKNGYPLFVEGIFRNITREKRRELSLAEEKKEREVVDTKNRIFSTISHELLTPMNGLMGTLDSFVDTELDYSQKELLDRAGLSADLLLNRIHELLDISDLGHGEIALTKDLFSPEELLKGIIKKLNEAALAAEIDLSLDIKTPLPSLLKGDRKRIEQIISNLVRNGIKFTPRGRVILYADSEETASGKIDLKISVKDDGIGIPTEKIASIFEPFTQVDSSSARRRQGIGLSLAINKQLVELMGGSLDVTSALGEGSVFSLSLPLDKGSAREKGAAGGTYIYPGSKVLIVDDNPMNREIAADLLAMRKIKIVTAAGGREGLDAMAGESPDLVFMDIQMPGMDGYETVRLQREREAGGGRVPIIALTANVTDKDRDLAYNAGMDGFLSKPIDRRKIDIILNKWLKDYRLSLEETESSLPEKHTPIPGIAMEETLERFSGEYDILKELLKDYREDYGDFGAQAADLMEREDKEGLFARIHALKGVSGSLGITDVYEISRRMADGYRETAMIFKEDLAALEGAMSRFLKRLNSYFEEEEPV